MSFSSVSFDALFASEIIVCKLIATVWGTDNKLELGGQKFEWYL